MKNDFLDKITKVIEANIANEQFGVSELAGEIAMSRSNLLRKVKKMTNLSASQFINQVRLSKAMGMLNETSLTVSEISYEVGFSSPSYFIKCFRDQYGYPPGEAGKRNLDVKGQEIGKPSSQTHQLAAIMFTDIEGYTALMQQDEAKALIFRNRHREVFREITDKYKGKILQYYGDGTLSTFNSAIDAVKCGIELQLAYREEPRIPVRIGIHSADIIFREDGIIGDGVNVAARIESLAIPQSVLISEKVYDEVKNQAEIQTVSLGEFEFKNVSKAMEVYAIANPGLIVPEKDKIKGKLIDEPGDDRTGAGNKGKWTVVRWILIILAAMVVGYLLFTTTQLERPEQVDTSFDQAVSKKSIVVLPFRNESDDASNVYIINGLMEAILNNLQNIEDLRVISRTSAEKYRNASKTSPEIARELNVSYLIEGSGQKIGDKILLNIQLIEANTDRHLWSEQYNREIGDIFELQMEVAKNIAGEIEVIITPEEEERINKPPTDDLVAYDYFLQGLDLINTLDHEKVFESIGYFKKAIEQDPEFARAHAAITMAYFYLDEGQAEKKYGDQIEYYGDKALLLDATLPQSLIAKALFYMHNNEYKLAVPYLEKALEYKPNYDLVFVYLIDIYVSHLPDTEKYLEYALRGLKLDVSSYDSIIASMYYLHISNAFLQSGFIQEAEQYIQRSLDYQPDNLYSAYVRAYVLYAKNRDLEASRDLIIDALEKDSTRLDIMQEVAKFYYFQRDYENAYKYYKKFIEIKEAWNLSIYNSEDLKIAVVLDKLGLKEESERYFTKYKEYAENNQSIYRHMNLATYYSYKEETEKAIEHLELFSEEDNYFYWVLVFTDIDPLMDNIKDLPEYKKIMKKIDDKFWDYHNRIKSNLEEKDLI
jgi:TolB-like protein/class 3 adenylate cyclase/Tfp pilus assembly protein PilF